MPLRLFLLAIIMVLLAVFIGFNVENRCDVSFAFYTLEQVPVILTILASFALGLLAAFPFALRSRKAKNTPEKISRKKKAPKGGGDLENVKDERFPDGGTNAP